MDVVGGLGTTVVWLGNDSVDHSASIRGGKVWTIARKH